MTKRLLKKTLSSRYLTPLWIPLARERIAIFTLHRFAVAELGVDGHDPALLHKTLAKLRRGRYTILSLEEAVRRLRERLGFPPRSLVFTVDDGYFDFAHVGAKIFSAFDAPITMFVTTGFLEGTHWNWWDQIEYLISKAPARAVSVSFQGIKRTIQLEDRRVRPSITTQIVLDCKELADQARRDFMEALSVSVHVEIPSNPPARYAPMSWEDTRRLEEQGVTFGSHTMSHPILIRATDEDVAWQIGESWNLLQQRIRRPLPILAYPNGNYGSRELVLVSQAGLGAAVTTEQAYASAKSFHTGKYGKYTIPRFDYPEFPDNVCLTAAGFTRMSAGVRRAMPFLP